MLIIFIIAFFSYLLGSIPFGFLAGKLAGTDVRKHGSGNIGATNVVRVLGRKYGYPVFFADAVKGLLAVRFALWLAASQNWSSSLPGMIATFFALMGHSYPIWLRFRGGKAVATSAGACVGLIPPLASVIVGAIWIATFFLFRFVSLASIAAAIALPLAVWLVSRPTDPILISFSVLVTALIILRHRSNIQQLWEGTEPRFKRR